jgi:hypothetical protein
MLVGKKKHQKLQGTSIKVAKNCPLSTEVLFLCPKLPSFWLFFGNGNSFFALQQSSNHVFQNFN